MKLLSIIGSPRKGKANDQLVDKATEGAKSIHPNLEVNKIFLAEKHLEFCKNCMICRSNASAIPYAKCVIDDDMNDMMETIFQADLLIFSSSIHMGFPTAIMSNFLARICWTFSKPEGRVLNMHGIPVPRVDKKRKAVIILTTGLVPPIFKIVGGNASVIKTTSKTALNAKTIATLFAGAIETRGVELYYDKAIQLGKKLCK